MIRPLQKPAIWAGAAVALSAGIAQAEGPGIRRGDLLIHPDAFVQGAFDNNVFLDDASESPKSSPLLRVGGGLTVENRSPNKLSLDAGAGLSYRQYLESGKEFDARSTVDRANLNAAVGFLPRAPITVEIHEDGTFRDNPAYDDTEFGFRMLDNSLGLDLRFRPGQNPDSRPFEMRLGYRWQTTNFIGDDAAELNTTAGEKDSHNLRFLTTWRFLPKTALLAEVGWTSLSYDKELEVSVLGPGGTSATAKANRDARPFFVLAGVKGLVTRRVSTTLKAGYKNTFNAEGSSFSSVFGTAELMYALEPALRASIGYNRDGHDSAVANFYTLNQVYGGVDFYFLGQWSLGGRIGFDHYAYSDDAGGVDRAGVTRTDPVLRGNLYAGFNPKEWMTFKLDLSSQQNLTDFKTGVASDAATGTSDADSGLDPVAYSRQLVMLECQVKY